MGDVAGESVTRSSSIDTRILDAALELLRDRGPLSVTIEGVAAASGIAKTTIYRRYDDREELLRAAIESASTEVSVPTELSTYDTFRWLLQEASTMAETVVGRGTAAAILVGEDPGSLTLLREMITARARLLLSLVEERVARGDLRADLDLRLVATILFGAVLGQVIRGGDLDDAWADSVLVLLWPAFEA